MISKVTLDQISKEIGISRTTIYKVINNRGTVSDKTKEKVMAAIEKYNYVPNYNARDLAKGKTYRIAYIGTRHLSAKYFSILVNEGLKQAYNDFVDHGLEILIEESDFGNPQKQLKDIVKMRKMGIENFIIAPSDEHLLRDKILELYQQRCNVILLSRYIDDMPKRTYVGVDYYQSGMLAGEMLTKIMPQGGRIAVLTNSSPVRDTTVKGRYNGFMDWIKNYPGFEVVESIEEINSDEQAEKIFDCLCRRYENFEKLDAVYDITYKLSIFAQKLTQMNRKGQVKLVGFDIYPQNVEFIRNSTIDYVVGQQLREQAYDAVKMLFQKICYGVHYEQKDYFSKLEVIVSSNVDYFA